MPSVYIAYRTDQSQGSEVTHNNLRARYDIGEAKVHQAMKEWAKLTEDFREALKNKDQDSIHELINRNYDIRESLLEISEENKLMVRLARFTGTSAKFTGSGGAIIGTYKSEEQYQELVKNLSTNGIEVIKPQIVCNKDQK